MYNNLCLHLLPNYFTICKPSLVRYFLLNELKKNTKKKWEIRKFLANNIKRAENY